MAANEGYERPIVTVDIVLMTVEEGRLVVALLERENEPYKAMPALIGGYIHTDDDRDAEGAVRRILSDKAGLRGFYFEQLQTFAGCDRDPRGWSVSITYLALVPHHLLVANPTTRLSLRPADEPGDLPFDHAEIVAVARQRLRGKGAYSSMVARLLPDMFTMSDLQGMYEIVLGEKLDQSAFRRKIKDLNLLEDVQGQKRQTTLARRPTTLYRLKNEPTVFDRRI